MIQIGRNLHRLPRGPPPLHPLEIMDCVVAVGADVAHIFHRVNTEGDETKAEDPAPTDEDDSSDEPGKEAHLVFCPRHNVLVAIGAIARCRYHAEVLYYYRGCRCSYHWGRPWGHSSVPSWKRRPLLIKLRRWLTSGYWGLPRSSLITHRRLPALSRIRGWGRLSHLTFLSHDCTKQFNIFAKFINL